MVETRPVGCGLFRFWVVLVVFVLFSTIRLFFPSFNDDLGTMPTRRPYSWKKSRLERSERMLIPSTHFCTDAPFKCLHNRAAQASGAQLCVVLP